MNELKDYRIPTRSGNVCHCYLKSEADKVIAELKAERDTAEKLLNKALDCVSNGNKHIISLARKNNHSNYKRCLAMADKCVYLCNKARDLCRWAEEENLEYHYNRKFVFSQDGTIAGWNLLANSRSTNE